MTGLGLSGLFVVCATCESELEFAEDPTRELGFCRACGEAFLVDAPVQASAAS